MFKIAHPLSDSGFQIPDFRIQVIKCSESGIRTEMSDFDHMDEQ
jgi:hypothetical protein